MTPVIEGRDCIIEVLSNGTYHPVLCAEEFTFTVTQEIILKTGPNSGLFRERKARLSDWEVQVSGLTPVDDPDVIGWFYLLQNAVRRALQSIRMTFEDTSGDIRYVTGMMLIEEQELTAAQTDFANASINFIGSGPFEIDTIIDGAADVCEVIEEYYLTLAEGETTVTHAAFAPESGFTKSVIGLSREGTTYAGTSGTPGNQEFSFNAANGVISFDSTNPGLPGGENIWVLLKKED